MKNKTKSKETRRGYLKKNLREVSKLSMLKYVDSEKWQSQRKLFWFLQQKKDIRMIYSVLITSTMICTMICTMIFLWYVLWYVLYISMIRTMICTMIFLWYVLWYFYDTYYDMYYDISMIRTMICSMICYQLRV